MQNPNPARHGLSAAESRQLTERVLKFARAENTRVNLDTGIEGFTRTAVNRVTTAGVVDDITVVITSAFGKRAASVSTNRLDDASLERAVRESEALAKIAPENPEYFPELGPQKYVDVDGYYPSTGNLTTESRAQAAALTLKAAEAAKTVAAGFIAVKAGSQAIANSKGLFGYYSGTGVSSTLTVRTPDGSSSGWAGDQRADWNTMESRRVGEDAVRKCQQWRGKTSLAPGKYQVVLEPTAVGALVGLLAFSLDARGADEGRSFFSRAGGGNRIGEKLLDSRVSIFSDPAEKNGEATPFTLGGLPRQREAWFEGGVLKALAYNRFWADRQGVAPRAGPSNFMMSGGNASVAEMVKAVKRGVLVTRFFYIRSTDPRRIAYTGVTRDGTFLIENGKVTRPVNNFRFNQSVPEMLANVEMLGPSTRIASEDGTVGEATIVPPLLVRDFNLTSVSDAI